ncbi:hypothetical protein GXW82_32045 [Streptacidiphilus sp. 4-A2]|nr:hypothetical protein [Streptacidiphilus sp. 4-A2]
MTNYNRSDGSWYGWQYLGGVVDGGIKVSGVTDGGWVFSVVAGTDGYPWSRTRSADGSNWTGWALPACPDPDDDAGCS